MTLLREAVAKLKCLRHLPNGWNYGQGEPLTPQALRFGLATLHVLNTVGARRFDVLPSGDGGATLLATTSDDLAEIVIDERGNCDLYLEANGECKEYEGLDFSGLIRTLEDAGWRSPKSSGSRTHVFTVESTAGSPVRLFGNVVMARRSSTQVVSRPRAEQFATTSTNFMEDWEDSRQSSADFQRTPYLLAQG